MSGLPDAWAPVLDEFRAGASSPQLALAKLVMADAGADPATLLESSDPQLADLAREQAGRLNAVRAVAAAGRTPLHSVEDTRALFDDLARTAPEAGVAIYSLGDPKLLDAATAELAAQIESWIPLAGRTLLDFGCGIGRLAVALAPCCGKVVGIDLSPGMIAEAEQRAAGIADLSFRCVDAERLAIFEPASFDVIVAADSFPYLVALGEAAFARQLGELARLLRPGGDLLVFNWSYRGEPDRDIADARRLAPALGLDLLRAGEHPFRIWDASAFHLRRA